MLTLDDIFAIEHVQDAQISPDGRQVAFVVTRGYTVDHRKLADAAVWLAPFDGSAPPRRATFGPRSDSSPRWSPDGQTLAFLSDREKQDVQQIYLLPLAGGEARRRTDLKAGVTDFAWSPDGAALAFRAPEAESEETERRKKEGFDAVHVDHDHTFTRLWVIRAEGGEARPLTPPTCQVQSFAWFDDGWAVQVSATPSADDFVGWRLLHVAEEAPEALLWQARYGSLPLAGSADGRRIAWLHQGVDSEGSVDEVLALTVGGTPQQIAADYSGGMSWVGWMPDGESLLVAAVEGTSTRLGRVAALGGAVADILLGAMLAEGPTPPCVSVSRDGTRIACVTEAGRRPKEVYAGELGGKLRPIARRNEHLAAVHQGATQTIRWRAPDGLEVEGVLITPADYVDGQRAPLVVHIHGGPLWQWLDRHMASWHDWGQWLAAHGYAVLLPNPRGSFGRGRSYAHCNQAAWGIGDFGDVLSGVDHAIDMGVADGERLGIGGWSYGGYLSAWAIGHTDRFKAAVVGAGVTNLLSFQASDIPSWLPREQMLAAPTEDLERYLRCSPIVSAGRVVTPTLVLHGEADERVPLGQGRELYHALRARQVPVEMVVYPREPHGIGELHHQRDLLERVIGWFNRWLKEEGGRPEGEGGV
jgi:dipeptidyl aminopeptidase/acylaminoacyl peptidase